MMEVACMLQYQVPTPEELERLGKEEPSRPTAGSSVEENDKV